MEMGVESYCASLWKTRVKVDLPFLVKAYSNIFCFGFEKASDRKWVLDHGPWCIKGDLLVMMSWSSSFGIKELSFNTRRLWIQIHNLPHDLFFRANANLLGAQAGRDVSIELDESKLVSWNNWIRVQVEIEGIPFPLCGQWLNILSPYPSCFSGKLKVPNGWVKSGKGATVVHDMSKGIWSSF
ncbi:hypothetical protein F8388_014232 [Cannabis sativa]|uniref:DUF4283 domain-containing protein n=1 Tax=Cannabis sativa TaxID=3483 RepID=A0A7J6GSR6_CANSA|nr:hypothetical protein F8388_014232 [Cannabis sativa]